LGLTRALISAKKLKPLRGLILDKPARVGCQGIAYKVAADNRASGRFGGDAPSETANQRLGTDANRGIRIRAGGGSVS
jgi:hypothetical protein